MSNHRSGSTSSRPSSSSARPGVNLRPTLTSILHHPTASSTAVPTLTSSPKPERSLSFPNASPKTKQSPRHNPSRIIKTFEEIEVTKIVMAEEWYEELECGICSQILGSAMSLVPCGHTFCGPCTWHWIISNKNSTCPHCRVQVPSANPFIPNIVVDQVIERKLKALPDSKERTEMVTELKEKVDQWKVIQAANPPAKPLPPKRGRSFEDFLNLVVPPIPERQDRATRRASGHLHELGAPIPVVRPRGYDLNLANIHRINAEEDATLARAVATAAEIRRLQAVNQRQGMALAALAEADDIEIPVVPGLLVGNRRRQVSNEDARQGNAPAFVPSRQTIATNAAAAATLRTNTPALGSRPQPTRAPSRPSVFANRQARGREAGSRESPLVLSDSD